MRTILLLAAMLTAGNAPALTMRAMDCPIRPFFGGGNLSSEGQVGFYAEIAHPGTYTVEIKAYGNESEGEKTKMALCINGTPLDRVTVDAGIFKPYKFEVELSADVHSIGAYFLNPSSGLLKSRNLYLDAITLTPPPGAPEPVSATEAAWLNDGPAREKWLLDQTPALIDKHRKSTATLTVTAPDGKPLANTEITVELTRHDFLFGCNLMAFRTLPTQAMNDAYEARFAELFNYATLPFYWHLYEPEQGKPNYAQTDDMLAWCEEKGIATKGHTLLWQYKYGMPKWSGGKQPAPEIQKARVDDLMGRYRARIPFWEVVNEPANQPGVPLLAPHQWARAADPAAKLIINEYGILYIGHYKFHEILQQAIADGVPFDGIGIQAHAPTTEAFPIDRTWRVLEMYRPLGKGLHITEFCPGSNGEKATGAVWRGTWTEQSVAEYAEQFYRACFAHPSVEAISWWDFADAPQIFVPNSGLLSLQMEPKPAYLALKRLIKEEWHTKFTATTDANGQIPVTGFLGAYTLAASGKTASFQLGKAEKDIRVALN